eukprot:scaffold1740_cov254-Pinguiococcus_pyrenoidosus.AAC.26
MVSAYGSLSFSAKFIARRINELRSGPGGSLKASWVFSTKVRCSLSRNSGAVACRTRRCRGLLAQKLLLGCSSCPKSTRSHGSHFQQPILPNPDWRTSGASCPTYSGFETAKRALRRSLSTCSRSKWYEILIDNASIVRGEI